MIFELILHTVIAFVASLFFSLIFNIPRSELVFCGFSGALGFFVYKLTLIFFPGSAVTATFFSTLFITMISRILSYLRRMPVSAYLTGGIIVLVPGTGIYYTIYELVISNEGWRAASTGVETAKIAGVIAVGIMCVLSLPRALFDYTKFVKAKP